MTINKTTLMVLWAALWLIIGIMVIACGEKPCNVEGSTKVEKGQLYYCTDRGNGLQWYESSGR